MCSDPCCAAKCGWPGGPGVPLSQHTQSPRPPLPRLGARTACSTAAFCAHQGQLPLITYCTISADTLHKLEALLLSSEYGPITVYLNFYKKFKTTRV